MTNREWILEEIQSMSDEELAEIICGDYFDPKWCLEGYCDGKCTECKAKWLSQEYKDIIKLSEAERVILENIDKKYKWIARDYGDDTYVYMEKPTKDASEWSAKEHVEGLRTFNHLFQFINWEDAEPYKIDELLK